MTLAGFENDLMILLSRAERSVDSLKQEGIRNHPVLALEVLQKLINSFVSFDRSISVNTNITQQLRDDLSTQFNRIPESCLILRNATGISLQSAMELFSHWADSPADRRRIFQQLGRASVGLLRTLLKRLLTPLDNAVNKNRWRDLFQVFVKELESAVEAVSF